MSGGGTLGQFAGFHPTPIQYHGGLTGRSKPSLEAGCSELASVSGGRGEGGWEVGSRPGAQKTLRGKGGADQFTLGGLGELPRCVPFLIVLKVF